MSAGVDLAWEATGDARAPGVVLVHSLGTDRSIWDSLTDALRGAYRVLRVDLRGHGASTAPAGPYSLEQLAGDVLRAADAACIPRFHYCGISLGGMVGLHLASAHPHRVHGLVAANTAAKIGTAQGWEDRCTAARATGFAPMADGVLARWFAPGFAEREPTRFENARRVLLATSVEGYVGCCQALAQADLTAALGQITAPALVIGGDLDVSTPVVDSEALHAGIGGSRLLVLPGAAHLSNLDASEPFDAAVTSFLGDCDASARN
ncbi:MAG TPA: 3-oxoadipate enol-lactonase [Polyangiaceae bacterium]|jgi:3-oxoadipate enol-lactonase|nr:3-oxoadipate enol-lactonase [Polyangiaceae bacterium]